MFEAMLNHIKDSALRQNIEQLARCFIEALNPIKVILFGSFANGTYSENSDYDFYLVVDDGRSVSQTTDDAYRAVTYVKKRPVDIVVGTETKFYRKRSPFMIESEVKKYGILLYDKAVHSYHSYPMKA